MSYEDGYKEFEQYLSSGEPEMNERARNCSMAIGLQDVHRLKPSEFLFKQLKANIKRKITKNRTFYIRWNGPLRHNDVSEEAKRQNDVLKTPLSFCERLSLKEI